MTRVLFTVLLCTATASFSTYALSAPQELTIPNFDSDSPACVVTLPETAAHCTPEGCALPVPKYSTLESLQLSFSCLPKSAPTGFENPAADVKIQPVRAKNARGHLSLIDDIESPPAERTRQLGFCLYGKQNNLCGDAKTLRLRDGAKGDATAVVKSLIQSIELQGASTK